MRDSKTPSPTCRYVTFFVVACQFLSFSVAVAEEQARTVSPHESTLFDQIQDDLAKGASHWTADSSTLSQQPALVKTPFDETPFDDDSVGHASFEEFALDETPIGEAQIEQASYSSYSQLSQPVAPQLVPATLGQSRSREGFNIAVGFDFLQPSWSNDSFQQLLPGTTAALFPGLNLDSTVDHDYGLSPRIDVGLALGDSEYGISAGVNTVNLSGSIRQNTAGMATNDSIDAQSAINILSVNLPEVSRVIPLDIYEDDQIDDAMFELRVGARYSAINQLFTAALRQGSGSSSDDVFVSGFSRCRAHGGGESQSTGDKFAVALRQVERLNAAGAERATGKLLCPGFRSRRSSRSGHGVQHGHGGQDGHHSRRRVRRRFRLGPGRTVLR